MIARGAFHPQWFCDTSQMESMLWVGLHQQLILVSLGWKSTMNFLPSQWSYVVCKEGSRQGRVEKDAYLAFLETTLPSLPNQILVACRWVYRQRDKNMFCLNDEKPWKCNITHSETLFKMHHTFWLCCRTVLLSLNPHSHIMFLFSVVLGMTLKNVLNSTVRVKPYF